MSVSAMDQSTPTKDGGLALVNEGLLALQAALLGRSVYGAEHATLHAQVDQAVRCLNAACDGESDGVLRVVHAEDRLIVGGRRLPESTKLIDGLFGALSARGIDGLTLRSGLTHDEACGLLDALAGGVPSGPSGLAVGVGSLHVSPAYLEGRGPKGGSGHGAGALVGLRTSADVRETADRLAPLWERFAAGSGLGVGGDGSGGDGTDADALGQLVDRIGLAVKGDGADAMLPMADLKRHDEYTFIHTMNVGILAAGLAEAVGLPAGVVRDVTVGALLHDVGKKQTPLEVLNKAGKLEEHEFRIMRNHPVDGARILLDTPGVPELAPIIAYEHHIHRDGTGYPHVRPGYVPHLGSQITQLADVFDALRTHRPYRKALPLPKVLEIMGEGGGERYDRALLAVFFERVVVRSSRDGDGVSGDDS